MTRILPNTQPIPCEQEAITAALSKLALYGGIMLGFVVDRPTEPMGGIVTNIHVAMCIAQCALELTGGLHSAVYEDTKQFPSKTMQHVDGLHISRPFLQVHTTHASDYGAESYVMLRARQVDERAEAYIRSEANNLEAQGVIIDGLVDVPHSIFSSIKKLTPLVAQQPLLAAADQSIVFINGCPAKSVQPIGRIVSHDFSTTMGGEPSAAQRLVSFSRVERLEDDTISDNGT